MADGAPSVGGKPRLLILVVAYAAEKTIQSVLSRIPGGLIDEYHVEVLVIDDASADRTFERADEVRNPDVLPFALHVLTNPVNQGYGGNQKLGYHFAVQKDFDFVALLHGDGQYAPERLPDLVQPLRDDEADAVFGSRMLTRGAALKGGMPLYKFVGNKILSWFENRMLRTSLSEFHSGYRVYSVEALKRIPWQLNTDQFHFDTEIIIQLVLAQLRIKELAIPTYYGDEISRVNGLKYAWDVATAVLTARLQEVGFLYDPRFDCVPERPPNDLYRIKSDYLSPQTACLGRVKTGTRVLDIGCANPYMCALLKESNHCSVTGVAVSPRKPGVNLDRFIPHDLNAGAPAVQFDDYDYSIDARRARTSRIAGGFHRQLKTRNVHGTGHRAASKYCERRLLHTAADAVARTIQLRQARHSRYDPYPSVHFPKFTPAV